MKKTHLILLALGALCSIAVASRVIFASPAQSAQPTSETYSWSAELVALDEGARTITVKSRVVGDQALAELARFKPSDRIMLTWSGINQYANGIYRAVKQDSTKNPSEPFTFAVEFVAFEAPRQYVTFKTHVPQDSVANLASLKPGEWVTATSRHRPRSETESIVTVKPYNSSSSTSSN